MRDKIRAIAIKNSNPVGFIKAVSYKDGTFKTTQNIKFAKGYDNEDEVHKEIDFLTKHNQTKGYVFIYR